MLPGDFALHETAQFAQRLSHLIKDDFNVAGVAQLSDHKAAVKGELARYI
jgi:hypothetical protein